MEEIWKDIKGYEGLYKVSNTGRVLSLHYAKTDEPKVLKPILISSGYHHVSLFKNNTRKYFLVHVLVASAFIPNKENKPQVNHIDGIKTNNCVSNLEWVTAKENQQHAIKNGLRDPKKKRKFKSKETREKSVKAVLQYNQDGTFVKLWDSQSEAAYSLGIQQSCISKCASGKRKMCCGFIWVYYSGGDIHEKISKTDSKRIRRKFRNLPNSPKRKCRKFYQYNKSGEFIREWENYIVIEKETGYDISNILHCVNGKSKSAYGYIWK